MALHSSHRQNCRISVPIHFQQVCSSKHHSLQQTSRSMEGFTILNVKMTATRDRKDFLVRLKALTQHLLSSDPQSRPGAPEVRSARSGTTRQPFDDLCLLCLNEPPVRAPSAEQPRTRDVFAPCSNCSVTFCTMEDLRCIYGPRACAAVAEHCDIVDYGGGQLVIRTPTPQCNAAHYTAMRTIGMNTVK